MTAASFPTPESSAGSPYLITVSGQDAPGLAEQLFAGLAAGRIEVEDVEQVRVHGRLLLCVETVLHPGQVDMVRSTLARRFGDATVTVTIDPLVEAQDVDDQPEQHLVTVLAPDIDASTLEAITGRVAESGGNIDRIVRLASYPVHSYELTVVGADLEQLRRSLGAEAVVHEVDIAVQAAGLHRRAKHLIVMDADSTLLQGEVIDLLASTRWLRRRSDEDYGGGDGR